MKNDRLKKQIIVCGNYLLENKLVIGPGGNISCRQADITYITPSGKSFDELSTEDIIGIDIKSKKIIEGKGTPSSEVSMHRGIYLKRKDVKWIIHTHPPISIAIIGAGAEIRPLYPDVALFLGKKVPVLDYITVCTQRLADKVVEVIADHNAVLLKRHGLITVGTSIKEAVIRTMLVEETAKMIVAARTIGKESIMIDSEIEEMNNLEIEKYRREIIKE